MSVTVKINSLLQKYTDGQESVEVSGANPIECLKALDLKYPKLKKWLYDKEGNLRPQMWVFVNGERLFAEELTRPLKDGDELSILLAIAGG